MYISTVSSRFQISIPKKLRNELHIKAGQKYIFIAKGSCLYLVPKRNINSIKGLVSGCNTDRIRDHSDSIQYSE